MEKSTCWFRKEKTALIQQLLDSQNPAR